MVKNAQRENLPTMLEHFKIQDLYCHMHNIYMEAVVGNEILTSQAPSNYSQKIYKENVIILLAFFQHRWV